VRGDAAVDNAEHTAHDLRATGEQEAQRKRDAQHPLAHRLLGKHLVDQQRGTRGHAPSAAAGTKATLLAAESNQMLRMATVAAHPQKTVLETPALEVFLELLLNISRQVRALRRQVRLERGIVFLDELIKEGALRAVTHIRRRADTRTGFPASRKRQHDRILAKLSTGPG